MNTTKTPRQQYKEAYGYAKVVKNLFSYEMKFGRKQIIVKIAFKVFGNRMWKKAVESLISARCCNDNGWTNEERRKEWIRRRKELSLRDPFDLPF